MADEKNEGAKSDPGLLSVWQKIYKLPGGDRDPFDPDLLRELQEMDAAFEHEQSNQPPLDAPPEPKPPTR